MLPENFSTHPVFEKLDQLNQVLSTDNAKEKISKDTLLFFVAGYNYTKDRLRITLPILLQETELTALSSEMDACVAQINAFLGNSNTGHLTNATNNITSALNRVRNFPLPFAKGDFDFSKAVAEFQRVTQDGYRKLDEIHAKLRGDLTNTENDLAARRVQLESLEKQLAEKDLEIKNALAKHTSDFENLRTKTAADVEEDRKKSNANIEGDRKLYKEQFDKDNEAYRKSFDDLRTEKDNESKEIIKNLNLKLTEAKNIVSIIGNVGVTGNYQNIANEHRKSANFFRW